MVKYSYYGKGQPNNKALKFCKKLKKEPQSQEIKAADYQKADIPTIVKELCHLSDSEKELLERVLLKKKSAFQGKIG